MRQTWVCRLLPVVWILALAAPIYGQSFGFAWWKDPQFQHELALSADQSARIDAKVEAIRSQMNKMRTLMLLKERQILSPDQRVKLNKLHEQWERDHKRPSQRGVK